jgi:hypothetical protein
VNARVSRFGRLDPLCGERHSILRRRIFNLAATLSLVLCIAAVALWINSEFHSAILQHVAGRDAGGFVRTWEIDSRRGSISWEVVWHWSNSYPEFEGLCLNIEPPRPRIAGWLPRSMHKNYGASTQDDYSAAGFFYERFRALSVGWDRRGVEVPDWFLIAVLLVLPAMRWAPRRRPAPGSCPTCGYDLRATPQRCPECGATPSVPSEATSA